MRAFALIEEYYFLSVRAPWVGFPFHESDSSPGLAPLNVSHRRAEQAREV